jgi:hypothetical protein
VFKWLRNRKRIPVKSSNSTVGVIPVDLPSVAASG